MKFLKGPESKNLNYKIAWVTRGWFNDQDTQTTPRSDCSHHLASKYLAGHSLMPLWDPSTRVSGSHNLGCKCPLDSAWLLCASSLGVFQMHTRTTYVAGILNLKKEKMMKKKEMTMTTCSDRSLCGWPACLGILCLTQGQFEESHAPWCIVEFSCWVMSHTGFHLCFCTCVLYFLEETY